MTKDEALKLKPGDKIKQTQTGEIYEFLEFVTYVFEPPIGNGLVVYAKLLDPDGRIGFLQPRDMGLFELVKDDS
jgi:hypothetical protein